MMESGIVVRKKVREMVTLKLETASGKISTHMVSPKWRNWVVTTYVAAMPPPKTMGINTRIDRKLLSLCSRRERT